jgi:hypothetical protein
VKDVLKLVECEELLPCSFRCDPEIGTLGPAMTERKSSGKRFKHETHEIAS